MTQAVPSYRYLSSSATDIGKARKLNEDSVLERPEIGLWAVADGMGGHESGDLASQTVVESLFRIAPPLDPAGLLRDVQWRIRVAHEALRREGARRGNNKTIGSTVVALLVSGKAFTCVWAGDSRLYLLRGGELRQVTRDHSLVQEMVEAGQLDPELAESHPHANVITRAVGAAEDLALERRSELLQLGDRLMLCSDGLSRYVSRDEIAEALGRPDIGEAAAALIRAALEHDARDNVTVIVVACEPADESGDDLADTLPRALRRSHMAHVDLETTPAQAPPPKGEASEQAKSVIDDKGDAGDAELDRILSGQGGTSGANPGASPSEAAPKEKSGLLRRLRSPLPRKD